MKSLLWADSGTYSLSNDDTLVITGQLGPGTWKRVWKPTKTDSKAPAGPGACGLLTDDEVAQALRAPVTGGPDPRAGEGGCIFRSQLGSFDQVSINVHQNIAHFHNIRKSGGRIIVDIPGVGDQAYAQGALGTGTLGELEFLKRGLVVRIGVGLHPEATMDDLPYLVELARAADRRMGGFSLPDPTDAQQKRIEAFEKAKAGGWKPGTNRPPQKGPKPFEGW